MRVDAPAIVKAAVRPLPWHGLLPAVLPATGAVLGLASLLLLVQMGGVTATGYDIRQLENARNDWERTNALLESYIAELQSLDRIERDARTRLGMVPAERPLFVQLPAPIEQQPPAAEAPPSHAKRLPRARTRQPELWYSPATAPSSAGR